jgi:hypothetical protein
MATTGNSLIGSVVDLLNRRLPPAWSVSIAPARAAANGTEVDGVLRVKGPGAKTARIVVEAKRQVEPRDVEYLAFRLKHSPAAEILVVAPFLSPSARQRLVEAGFGYADLTGNVRLTLSEPGLFVETHGADRNPVSSTRARSSLRGAKAGRLIRALCDVRPPYGVREMAKRAGIDAGYTSRLVDFLAREMLVTRQGRGPIATVDWPGLLRRWSQEYSAFQRDRATYYLAARGLEPLTARLRTLTFEYAVSGSWAAAQFSPVAPPRLLLLQTDAVAEVAAALDLRLADAGANVVLVKPFDPVVFARTTKHKGVVVTALSQVVADLFGAPGRGPNEAEALMQWMGEHEGVWRA